MNSEYYYRMYRSMLDESVKQEAVEMHNATWCGKNVADLEIKDLLNVQAYLEASDTVVKQMCGEIIYQKMVNSVNELISNKQKENDMTVKYYSSSKSDWIDIFTMNDVHLRNAFMALCREHDCDFNLIGTSPLVRSRFLLLIENNNVAQEMWIEIAKRFVKVV